MDKSFMYKYLAYISRYIHNLISARLREYNLGSGQSDILKFLIHKGNGKSQDEISKELEIDNTTTSRTIQRLVKNGYVKKLKDEKDRRINRIYLTEKSKQVDAIVKEIKKEVLEVLTDGITDEEFDAFMKVLEKMHRNAESRKGESDVE